jgi:hypothetical protein
MLDKEWLVVINYNLRKDKGMNKKIKEFDVAALLRDIPKKGLLTGHVGTVVEILADGVFEVEFIDDNGRTFATSALKNEELLLLHYESVAA